MMHNQNVMGERLWSLRCNTVVLIIRPFARTHVRTQLLFCRSDPQNKGNTTPLHLALFWPISETVRLLLEPVQMQSRE
jgi:hypothetical protein